MASHIKLSSVIFLLIVNKGVQGAQTLEIDHELFTVIHEPEAGFQGNVVIAPGASFDMDQP